MTSLTPSNGSSTSRSSKPKLNLVVQTAFLGDLLLSIPLLHWLRKIDPGVPIGLVCRKGIGTPLLRLKLVDHVWEVQKGNSKSYRQVKAALRSFDLNYLISPHTSFRTVLFCAGLTAKTKISFKKPWNYLVFHKRRQWPGQYPEALRLISLIKDESSELQTLWQSLPPAHHFIVKNKQGYLPPPPEWADPHQALSQEVVKQLSSELKISTKFPLSDFTALFPGSVWATKRWPKEKYVKLGQQLSAKGEKVIIMGGPEEKSLGEEVSSQIPGAQNLCGKSSLLESLLILHRAKLVIGNDSSSSHMAALMGVPVVSIFGPTVLEFGYRPWARSTRIFEKEGMSCRPCGLHGHKQCPLGHHNCMRTLDIDLD